jgi:transposase
MRSLYMRVRSTKYESEQCRRLQAAALFAKGHTPPKVAKKLGVQRQTAYCWFAKWKNGGEAALMGSRCGPKQRLSTPQLKRLDALLRCGPRACGLKADRWTLAVIGVLVHRTFGISYHASQLDKILHSLGWQQRRDPHPTIYSRLRWLPADQESPT